MNPWKKAKKMKCCQVRYVVLALTVMLALATVTGCAGTREAEKGEMRPTPAATYRFEDIPIPRSLEIEKKESFVYESEAIKTGILVYGGKAEVRDLAAFFKENMTAHGWRLISNFERDDALLSFTKPGWCCVIVIAPAGINRSNVEIRVGPIESL